MPDPPQPQNLQDLSAWIAGIGLYQKIKHATADFPDVGDFMICELEVALLTAVANIKIARERLRTIPGPHQAFVECAELATTSRAIVVCIDRSGIMDVDRSTATKLALAAKYRGCLSYQNIIIALAIGTRKLKEETTKVKAAVAKYQREVQARDMLMSMLQSSSSGSSSSSPTSIASSGDDDDWFVVGSEAQTPASTPGLSKEGSDWDAQERLYEEIEVRLAAMPVAEDGKPAEEEVVGLPRTRYEPGKRVEDEERARQGTIVVAMDDVAFSS